MIKVENLSKKYGSFLALDRINFEVNEGEIVAFLGPNGAGKTTTMRILTGFMPPTEGKAFISGMDVYEETTKVKALIGYLPENPPLYPELTVSEYLTYVAELKKVPKDLIKKNVDKVIELTDLGERKNTLIQLLSKGLKQRVSIAQSIVNSPAVIILDEPTVGLDPVQVVEIRNLIKSLAGIEKSTILISTHLLSEAQEICSKAIIINNGKIIAEDSIEALKQKQKPGFKIIVKALRNHKKILESLKKMPEIIEVEYKNNEDILITTKEDKREEIARIIVGMDGGLIEMTQKESSLEDIFLQLIQ